MGEEVGQEFLDHIVATYREQYQAVEPDHAAPAGDDATILAALEVAEARGGSDACALGRFDATPVVTP
jgi:hypothetical protein